MGNKQSTLVVNDTPVATVGVNAPTAGDVADANNNTPVNNGSHKKVVQESKVTKAKSKSKSTSKNGKTSQGCCATSGANKKKPWLQDVQLKVEKHAREDVIEKVENRIRDVQNSYLMQRRLITTPLWRESVTSLRPTDNIYKLGEKNSGLKVNTEVPPQDYGKLYAECRDQSKLFEDPTFPANDTSYYLNGRGSRKFKWLRPSEIVDCPKFFAGGANRFDVNQGELGNCWFLAAVANLTMSKRLFDRVVPPEQSFEENFYAGIFHFRFWQYGKWIDVVIDDRLPTYQGKLMLMHSKDQNEFWSALLEKAYAKLHGSYESLKGGTTSEAMEDFTGGLTEHFEIQTEECPENLFTIMLKAYQRGSFMGCSIAAEGGQMETALPNGLIKGHAYSITALKLVQIDHFKVQGKIPLLRIRNPWGNEAEWKGAWSDQSREWGVVSDEEKSRLGLTFDSDGEFWMSFADFKKNYTNVEITNLTPDAIGDEKRHWEVNYFEGQWIPGVTAGGCRNNLESFSMNPQYMITLVDHDEEDDEDLCTCVVALMQKNHRIKRKMGLDNLTIGFAIYEVKDGAAGLQRNATSGSQLLTTQFFRYNASVARSPNFINLREVSGRFRLKPGRYCIVPSTFESGKKGDFMIRFFTEKPAKNVVENDEEVTPVDENDTKTADGAEGPKQAESDGRSDAEKSAFAFFQKIAGADLEVDSYELQQVINHVFRKEIKFGGFSIESCRSMVAMMDADESGKLGFDEFIQLWRNLRTWAEVFKRHDKDKSNTIHAGELKEAFREVGINLNRGMLRLLVNRFGKASKKDANEDGIAFDDFICCALKMKRTIDVWNSKKQRGFPNAFSILTRSVFDNRNGAESTFTLEEFMRQVLYS